MTPTSLPLVHSRGKSTANPSAIGGAKDITEFTVFRDASSVRTTILKKYRESLSNYDHKAFRKEVAPKFPIMFNTSMKGIFARKFTGFFGNFIRFIFSAFSTIFFKPWGYILRYSKYHFIIFTILNLFAPIRPVSNAYLAFLGPEIDLETDLNVLQYPTTLALQTVYNAKSVFTSGFSTVTGSFNSEMDRTDYFMKVGKDIFKDTSNRVQKAGQEIGLGDIVI